MDDREDRPLHRAFLGDADAGDRERDLSSQWSSAATGWLPEQHAPAGHSAQQMIRVARTPSFSLHPDLEPGIEPAARVNRGRPSEEHHPMLCHELPAEQVLSSTSEKETLSLTPILDLSYTFRLSSRPGAAKTIYLDFNGHTTTGTAWNDVAMGSSFYSPAYDIDGNPLLFSDAELTRIQQVWQRVAADFAPFDVNVTTLAPPDDWLMRSGSADLNFGVRAVITSYGPYSTTGGGVAFVSSFTSSADTPVFIYNTSNVGVSEAISHEVGHSLGLSHDGTATSEYYEGHGSGETGWAPIMGTGYSRSVTTWDDGTYAGSSNRGSAANYGQGADDLGVIARNNGFSFQPDLVGNDLFSATALGINGGTVAQFGTIENRLDADCYSFVLLGTGDLSLSFDPYWYRAYVDSDGVWGGSAPATLARSSDMRPITSYPDNAANLDIAAKLFDAQGNLLLSADDPGLASSLSVQGLLAGTYYLTLDGVGFGDPTASTPTGYSDYGSIGNFMISGTITGAADPTIEPVITLGLSPTSVGEDGSVNLEYTFTRSVVTANPLTVNYTVSGTASNGNDYTGLLAGSSQAVTFAANAATARVVLDPITDSLVEADETVSLMLAPGMGYGIGTSSAVVGTISNDDSSMMPLSFSANTDILTGTTAADRFALNRLSDALWSPTPDRITNLQSGFDSIDSPVNRSTAIKPKQLGTVQTLDRTGIESLLSARNFVKNGAATFTFNGGTEVRTFLAINDATAGFNVSLDTVIEITGYSGGLSALAIF